MSGFNVYPNEVEAVAYARPDVFGCVAVGVADEKMAEAVRLFMGVLPKSNVGKILRRE